MMVQAGQAAPEASFDLADGTRASVSGYRGTPLVLYFYPKDNTPGCTREGQDFSALAPEFATLGVAVVGLSKDSVKSHAKFAGKYDLKIALGSDADGSACEAFGVWVEKSLYGRKYMGIERATFLIDANGTVAQVWRKVKVSGHADAVLSVARAHK